MDDNVKNPKHYAGDGKITCMDAMKSMTHGLSFDPTVAYWWLIAFKYLWRWPRKGGLEDLKKCRQSIDYLIEARYPMGENVEDLITVPVDGMRGLRTRVCSSETIG